MNAAVLKEPDFLEERNQYGYPSAPVSVPNNRGNFHNSVDNSVNKALPWVAYSWLLSGFSIGLTVMILALGPAYIDAKISASDARSDAKVTISEARLDAKVSSGSAQNMAVANTAREHARIALDKVEQTQVQLGAKGLVVPSTH